MSLLGKLFMGGPTHEEKVAAAYKGYRPELVNSIFPGGKKQASNIITSLAKVYGKNLNSLDTKQYYEILQTYSDIIIRKVITQSTDSHIITSLQVNHGNLVPNKEIARKALAYATINMSNHDFVLDSEESMSTLELMVDAFEEMESMASANAAVENKYADDPEYGLVPSKPIYTQGVNGSNRYLAGLCSITGEQLSWNRKGSMSVVGVNGIIDVYESTLPSGKEYQVLYLNMYGSSNSTIIPKGFKKKG